VLSILYDIITLEHSTMSYYDYITITVTVLCDSVTIMS